MLCPRPFQVLSPLRGLWGTPSHPQVLETLCCSMPRAGAVTTLPGLGPSQANTTYCPCWPPGPSHPVHPHFIPGRALPHPCSFPVPCQQKMEPRPLHVTLCLPHPPTLHPPLGTRASRAQASRTVTWPELCPVLSHSILQTLCPSRYGNLVQGQGERKQRWRFY